MWAILLRVQIAKHWAIDLEVDTSEVSRWSTGSRAMSLDDLVATVRVCRRLGHELVGLRVMALLATEIGAPAPSVVASPLDVALRTSEDAGDAARTVREVLADGHISEDEAGRFDELANRLEERAHQFRQVAGQARRRADASRR